MLLQDRLDFWILGRDELGATGLHVAAGKANHGFAKAAVTVVDYQRLGWQGGTCALS